MATLPHVSDSDRRARLAVRHGLHPDFRLPEPLSVARAMTALHATDPSTVHLAIRARAAQCTIADVDVALYDERTLVKQLAMRRTLWAVPREQLPALWSGPSARVATAMRTSMAKEVERSGLDVDGARWLDAVVAAVTDLMAHGAALTAAEVREQLPRFAGKVERSPGKKYATVTSLIPNVLTLMGAEGRLVRGDNTSHWRVSRPRWTLTDTWLGSAAPPPTPEEAYAVLLRSWLRTFGPGTEADIVWWFGATKAAIRQALADIEAAPVTLDSSAQGWVLPDDTAPTGIGPAPGELSPWAALLPTLDPTTMGWRERDFNLPAEHARHLFDSVGNGGTTVWLNGRVVGAWIQDDDARVQPLLLEPVSPSERRLIDTEASALTEWLDGEVIANVYKSSLMKGETLP